MLERKPEKRMTTRTFDGISAYTLDHTVIYYNSILSHGMRTLRQDIPLCCEDMIIFLWFRSIFYEGLFLTLCNTQL